MRALSSCQANDSIHSRFNAIHDGVADREDRVGRVFFVFTAGFLGDQSSRDDRSKKNLLRKFATGGQIPTHRCEAFAVVFLFSSS